MISKITPDIQKARALKKMAEITLERLKATDKSSYPANTLTDYYDALHKLMEAVALIEGVKARGEGAHQELIDHITATQKLGEGARQLLQQMREYRNRIAYEGFNINKNYIEQNEARIQQLIKKLSQKIK